TASDALIAKWLAETETGRINAGAAIGFLVTQRPGIGLPNAHRWWAHLTVHTFLTLLGATHAITDRKSTRLNSSHVKISYAVFCSAHHRHLHSLPTRRSSDLTASDALIAKWLAETETGRINAGAAIGFLVTQRPGIGLPNAHRWWAHLTVHTFLTLLGATHAI